MVKALLLVKTVFPVKVLSPAVVSLTAALLLFRQVKALCHGIAGVPEPFILISLFCEFTALLQMSGYVGPDHGGNPLRASQFLYDLCFLIRTGLFKVICIVLDRVVLVFILDVLQKICKLLHKLIPGHSFASLNIWDIFCE